jgi:hypothetical protein
MSDAHTEYWAECVSCAFEDCGAWETWTALTAEQKADIAKALQGAHECHGMAFYSPPASDRLNAIESEWRAKYEKLEREFESYRNDAETAVKVALRQYSDARVSIGKHGEVLRHGGRTEQIQ